MDEFSRDEEFGLLNRLDNATAWFLYFAKNHQTKWVFKDEIDHGKLHKMYICKVRWRIDLHYYPDARSVGAGMSLGEYISGIFQEIIQDEIPFFSQLQWASLDKNIVIPSPIMHSQSSVDRMIVIKNELDKKKWRWQAHQVKTIFYPIKSIVEEGCTICLVELEGWVRHQIRAHAASIWHPVIGDSVYWKKSENEGQLELYSIGVKA
jgi:23S rRNA-/tRNA-specific pseudouridylate synthase